MAESVYGKTLSGEELSGTDRVKHGVKGVFDLGLDLTGVGEIRKGAKMAYIGKKIADGIRDNKDDIKSLGKKAIEKPVEIAKAETAEEKQEVAVDSKKENEYAEKITNPEVVKIIDENSKSFREGLGDFDSRIGEKIQARAEKIAAFKENLKAYITERDKLEKESEMLGEEIPKQEVYVNDIVADIKKAENEIRTLEEQRKSSPEAQALKNQAEGNARITLPSEKNELQKLTGRKAEVQSLLSEKVNGNAYPHEFRQAYEKWKKSLSYQSMTENNPEFGEKLGVTMDQATDFFESTSLKREGLDKEAILDEYRNVAGSLAYGTESGSKMNILRGKSLDKIPSMDASAFAIGMKQEDIEAFLKSQEKLKGSVLEGEVFTQEDFDIARHRAYYEARRTAQNVYTHVMFPDAIKKVISDHALRSSLNLKNGGEAQHGIQRGEEAVYVTHGGGGYKNYGGKDFAFFAAAGSDILSHDRSLSVATPGLKEKGEAVLGRQVASFEGDNGVDMPVENMVFCCAERQVEEYKKIFLENGYSEEWVKNSVKGIPDDVHSKMSDEDESSWQVREKRHEKMPENEAFMNGVVKSSLRDKNAFDDKVYATIASRKSRDNNTKIHKWVAVN